MPEWFTSPNNEDLTPEQVMERAISEYKPVRIYACFSSGDDSLVTTHFAFQHGAHEAFMVNTTIAIHEAQMHFAKTCFKHGWPFRVKVPPDKDYERMVMDDGFPGPGAHIYPYSWLKERAIRELVAETKRESGDRVMLVTGVRRSESSRRMGYVDPIVRTGATVWVAPMYAWSKRQMMDYVEQNGLERSPVTQLIHISGECLCGAFAHPGERKELALWFPDAEARISELEQRAQAAGQPYCRWGSARRIDPDQAGLPFMPMCSGCEALKPEATTLNAGIR